MKALILLYYILYLRIGFSINKFFKKKNIKKIKKNIWIKNFKKNGYIIVNNFISKKKCTILKKEINNFYKRYPKLVWSDFFKAEIRIFGAQKLVMICINILIIF